MSNKAQLGGDAGFVALELALGVAVLLLPVAAIVLTIPTWSERQTTARAIAREVARIVARDGLCDTVVATGLATVMAANLGVRRDDVTVDLECAPGAPLPPGGSVQVDVTVRMPAVHLPALGTIGEWRWTARHREPVDLYGSAP
ncbi:MAG TPA: hypothetical protein VEP49_08840 [Acidimicrobiia bacterium]|nr:hypothetical protein [Acidimicrobiia bacterium]